jgi:outer membrane receptor protein involved in Fe transport
LQTAPTQPQAPTTAPQAAPGLASVPQGGLSPPSQIGGQGVRESAASSTSPGAIQIGGGQSQPRAAGDVGDFLGKSEASTGVEVQRRSAVIGDARIRAEHTGQVITTVDGAFYFPARLDLDTAVSKIDSSLIRDVIVVKGPYSAQYGPGFSYLDIGLNDTPRYKCYETHGRTQGGWQSNGSRLDAFQSFWGGSDDWGFRVAYGLRVGNDYEAGNGQNIAGSYNSQPWYFGLGYNFSPDSRIEFKGLHLDQRNIEFPGVYFDISHLTTDAESIRYTLDKQEFFDRFAIDAWYNRTDGDGNTMQGHKFAFFNQYLSQFFTDLNTIAGLPTPVNLADFSSTVFGESSRGYRFAFSWGEANHIQLTVGNDLNYLSQHLSEAIRIHAPAGVTPVPVQAFNVVPPSSVPADAMNGPTFGFQDLGIPSSHYVDPGLFAELAIPVSKRFNVRLGTRADFTETNSGPRLVTGNISTLFVPTMAGGVPSFNPKILSSQPNGSDDLQKEFNLWSAYLSADYKVDEHLTVLGGFGHAERPPTLTELYSGGAFIAITQQGLSRTYGDPFLAPERLNQFDIGLRANYGWFRGGVSGFYAWINDYITYDLLSLSPAHIDPANPTLPSSQFAQVVFTNTDMATLAGGEIYSEVDLNDYLTPFLTMQYVQGRDLTHIDTRRPANVASARRDVAQEPLPQIPPLEARLGLRLHEARKAPRWSVEFAARMVDEQNLVAATLGERPTPGFTVFDLRGYWQVTEAVLLTGGVENLGNLFYREHLDPLGGLVNGVNYDELFRPGTNFYMGVAVQY